MFKYSVRKAERKFTFYLQPTLIYTLRFNEEPNHSEGVPLLIFVVVEDELEVVVDVVLVVADVSKSISRLILNTVGIRDCEPLKRHKKSQQ